jgi:hypothetical protein
MFNGSVEKPACEYSSLHESAERRPAPTIKAAVAKER